MKLRLDHENESLTMKFNCSCLRNLLTILSTLDVYHQGVMIFQPHCIFVFVGVLLVRSNQINVFEFECSGLNFVL